jgi:phage-related protein
MELTANTGKTFIDAETQDCYEGTINRNGNLILSGEDIPELTAGENSITYTGFTAVQIIPRWWQL